jgi:hypothetical protein
MSKEFDLAGAGEAWTKGMRFNASPKAQLTAQPLGSLGSAPKRRVSTSAQNNLKNTL